MSGAGAGAGAGGGAGLGAGPGTDVGSDDGPGGKPMKTPVAVESVDGPHQHVCVMDHREATDRLERTVAPFALGFGGTSKKGPWKMDGKLVTRDVSAMASESTDAPVLPVDVVNSAHPESFLPSGHFLKDHSSDLEVKGTGFCVLETVKETVSLERVHQIRMQAMHALDSSKVSKHYPKMVTDDKGRAWIEVAITKAGHSSLKPVERIVRLPYLKSRVEDMPDDLYIIMTSPPSPGGRREMIFGHPASAPEGAPGKKKAKANSTLLRDAKELTLKLLDPSHLLKKPHATIDSSGRLVTHYPYNIKPDLCVPHVLITVQDLTLTLRSGSATNHNWQLRNASDVAKATVAMAKQEGSRSCWHHVVFYTRGHPHALHIGLYYQHLDGGEQPRKVPELPYQMLFEDALLTTVAAKSPKFKEGTLSVSSGVVVTPVAIL